jgi:4-amino-4-deoxy-L-arabinose transferase-like glycosyltransferase
MSDSEGISGRMTASNEAVTKADHAGVVEGIVDTLAESRIRSAVAIVILTLIAILPGLNTIAPFDRDEPRFALVAKHMVETGNSSDIALENHAGFVEPVGAYWLQAMSATLFGDGATSPIWVYRLPSVVAAIGAALLTWWMALAFGRPRAALLAAILTATAALFAAEARLAATDMMLLAALVAAQGSLARVWQKKSNAPDYLHALIFWTAIGAGILFKGIVAPLVVGLTIAVLSMHARSVSWLRRLAPIPGVIWLAVIVLPWFFIFDSSASVLLDGASIERIAVQPDYDAPPGTYAVLFYPLFGPAGVFVALAIPQLVERMRRPAFLFAVAWVVPFWLIMELITDKLPYYILPAYPGLALVGATAIDDGRLRVTGWISGYFSLNLLVWPIVVAIGAIVLFYVGEERLPFVALPFFLAAIVAGYYAFRWFFRGISVVGSAALSILSALLIYVGVFGVVLADLVEIQISTRLVAAAKSAAGCEKPEIASTGYFEPSLVFYAGDGIKLLGPAEAADFLSAGSCRVALVESRRQSIFNQRAEDLGLNVQVRGEVRGVDVGNFKKIKMYIFEAVAPTT